MDVGEGDGDGEREDGDDDDDGDNAEKEEGEGDRDGMESSMGGRDASVLRRRSMETSGTGAEDVSSWVAIAKFGSVVSEVGCEGSIEGE